MGIRLFAGAIAVALSLFAGGAQAANIFEKNFWLSGPRYDAVVPLCEDRAVGAKIAHHFSQKEGRFWNSALQIVGFEAIREISFREGHYATIPRRYCRGFVHINDGSRRPVYFHIAEDTGVLGLTWGVEWCVVGLDRNWAYNPGCRASRP